VVLRASLERISLAFPILVGRMRIRIIKSPPAPLMDGFDVRNMVAEQNRDVDSRTATYLVIAGYAVRIRANDEYPFDRNRRVSADQWGGSPPVDSDFREAARGNGNSIAAQGRGNGRAPLRTELAGPRRGAGQEQSRPEKSTDERQIAEPMEE
jgi:hypothetical protein